MNTSHSNSRFLHLLNEFESCLETPVVPGELSNWSQLMKETLDDITRQFDEQVLGAHAAMFQDIVKEDPGLHNRVTELQQSDERLMTQIEELRKDVHVLTEYSHYAEPDEFQLESHLDSTIEKGLKFVIAARKQEHALTTWFMEAFDRDRGIAD